MIGRFVGAATVALVFSTGVPASGLRVSPLRLDLSARQNATQQELKNLGSSPMTVQASVVAWTQENGQDRYTPSKDIFFAPPIISVPANGKAVVRLRLRGTAPKSVERAYRIYFQELPPPRTQEELGMTFRLRVGVPVFVSAAKPASPKLELNWTRDADGLRLVLTNSGGAHLKIAGMELYPRDVDRGNPAMDPVAAASPSTNGSHYLLPGSRHEWILPLSPALELERHALRIRTDDYRGKFAAGATARGWVWQEFTPGSKPVEPSADAAR